MSLPEFDDEPTLPSSKNPMLPVPIPSRVMIDSLAESQDALRIVRLEREILNMLEKRVVVPSIPDGVQLVLFAAVSRLRKLRAALVARQEAREGAVTTEIMRNREP